jgi:hypothetical protein
MDRKKIVKKSSLLIKLNDSVLKILKLKSKLRSLEKLHQIWVSPDLTAFQQNQMKKLREELTRRRQQGDFNLVIKYIKGTLQSVQKTNSACE